MREISNEEFKFGCLNFEIHYSLFKIRYLIIVKVSAITIILKPTPPYFPAGAS